MRTPTRRFFVIAWVVLAATAIAQTRASGEQFMLPRFAADLAVPNDTRTNADAQAKLATARKHWVDAWIAANAGQLANAVAAGEKGAALIREVYGAGVQPVVGLEFLATWYTEQEDWPAFRRTGEEIVTRLSAAYGIQDWRTVDARLDLAETNQLAALTGDERMALRACTEAQTLGGELHRKGQTAEALKTFDDALKERERILGKRHRGHIRGLVDQGNRYAKAGDEGKAVVAYVRAIRLWREVLGEAHPSYVDSVYALANFYWTVGRYTKAEQLYGLVPDLTRRIVGENHPKYATSLNNLAVLYVSLGRPEVAEPLHRRALELRRSAMGMPVGAPDFKHALCANSLHNLAGLYFTAGEYDRAVPLFREAYAVGQNAPGGQPADYLMELGLLYRQVGDFAKSETALLDARAALRRNRAAGSRKDAAVLDYLGGVYRLSEKHEEAERQFQTALDMYQTISGSKARNPNTLANLGRLYCDTGEYDKANEVLSEALAGLVRRHG